MYIFIFRRDLRLVDNNCLNKLIERNEVIIPIFILDPEQINYETNKYFSHKSVQFMYESLINLDEDIKSLQGNGLYLFYGSVINVLVDILENNINIKGIFLNEDYTPYSKFRDDQIKQKICKVYQIEFCSYNDVSLYDFKIIKTKKDEPYKRFKWFYEKTKSMIVNQPLDITRNIKSKQLFKSQTTLNSSYLYNFKDFRKLFYYSADSIVKGGRNNGLIQMNVINNLQNYKSIRQRPIIDKQPTSSKMSAYLKYGCISVREVFYKIFNLYGIEHELIRQLVWRDFYYNVVYFYPDIFLSQRYSKVNYFPWKNKDTQFNAWCNGTTGFPFIDASMRQLNKEGYMSNRGRLACANFLIKNLHIDWKLGEMYFANKLIDYDPSQNNGNWQWVSSSGFESQAYNRYINPDSDLIKFDSDCLYVKKYITELSKVNNKDILAGKGYIPKMVDLKESLQYFKENMK